MRALFPLVKDFITRLKGDEYLESVLGSPVQVYTERAPETQVFPYFIIDVIQALPWADQTQRGTTYTIQVSYFMQRGEAGTVQGIADVAKVGEVVRDLFDDRHGFDLDDSPVQDASVKLDFEPENYETNSGGVRLVRRQYASGIPAIVDPENLYIQGVARFNCVICG